MKSINLIGIVTTRTKRAHIHPYNSIHHHLNPRTDPSSYDLA